MFDVHYHLLFGVDDGPTTIEESVQLAEASIQQGITHIACTPHANSRYRFDPIRNAERMQAVQERTGGRMTLGTGCDFHLSDENIEDFAKDPSRYTINGHRYLLVEFSDFGIPYAMTKVLEQFLNAGFIPIITHPERNATLSADLSRLAEWVQEGCLVQITAGSLLGEFGSRAEAASHRLLKQKCAHVVASDAHSISRRPPRLRRAFEALSRKFGKHIADQLCIANPRAVFRGEPIPQSRTRLRPCGL